MRRTPMFPTIETVACEIEKAWVRVGHAEGDFGAIAANSLQRHLDLDFSTVARRLFEGAPLPEQRRLDQGFGQPALTLYYSERFVIEALCWHSGTPAIHQHAFNGAFRVATGQSMHSRYSFVEHDRIAGISLGDLRLERVELLDRSSTVEIPRGLGLIHSAFHLDSPSMTVVARTHQTAEPELTYLPPGVAYDSAARSPTLHKRLQLLDTLNQTGHEAYCDCVQRAIDNSDLYDGMAILMRAGAHRVDEPTYLAFTERLLGLHGPKVARLIAALIEERRRGVIVRLRSTVTDPHDRFFLGSLLSFSRRTDLLRAMAQRYGDPAAAREQVARGVGRLLGGDPDMQLIAAAGADAMLADTPAAVFPERAAEQWGRSLTDAEADKLQEFYRGLLAHPLLTPIRTKNGAAE